MYFPPPLEFQAALAGAFSQLCNAAVIQVTAAVEDDRVDALGLGALGDPQFITSVGWRWDRFSLSIRHISNASLHSPNDGETALVGAWRF